MAIYGNEPTLRLLACMEKDRSLPQSVLFYGNRGLGKKSMATHYAMTALCTAEENRPCGICNTCRKILHHIHPDVIWVEHSGKRQGFSVETIRGVLREVLATPNEGAYRIYIFADCDHMDVRTQNTLLKLTEEPPDHVMLLFTAPEEGIFLGTMLSRMLRFAMCPVTIDQCKMALAKEGKSPEKIEEVAPRCGGNIGKALDLLENEEAQNLVREIASLTRAIATRQQYDVLKYLSHFEKDANTARRVIVQLRFQIRDALAMRYHSLPDPMGCDMASARELSTILTLRGAEQMQTALSEALFALNFNVSPKLVLATLGGILCKKG